jgi:tetratricopeptide (TPR) repeat protein
LEINPQFYNAYGYMGLALRKQGKYKEAIQKYEKIIELTSDSALVSEAQNAINEIGTNR